MNCIDVIRRIILTKNLEAAQFTLLEHPVCINWRVQYATIDKKLGHIRESLEHSLPCKHWTMLGSEILDGNFHPDKFVSADGNVISISSKMTNNNVPLHLSMMNLHPDNGVGYKEMKDILWAVTNEMPGYLLESGRYYHFYGIDLLDEYQWLHFIAQFLMPTIIVSPRYIGHCLDRGYTTLRLTTEPNYKPMLPVVCDFLGDSQLGFQTRLTSG